MTVAQSRPVRFMRHDASERPFIVIWEVTRACQLVCTHCRADAIRTRNPFELTTDEGRHLLDDLASFGTPRPLVVLTGGDPFERPDLPELVAHGTRIGLNMALSPSVTDRLTRSVLEELHEAGAKAVSLSLDGATAHSHDSFRGVEGVFDATLDAARTVTDIGFRLQINTTVTRGNVLELPRMLRHVLDLGASLWSVFFLVPTGRGKALEPLTAGEAEEVLHWLHDVSDLVAIKTTEAPHYRRIAIQRAGSRSCSAGRSHGGAGRVRRSTSTRAADSRSSTTSEWCTPAGSCPLPLARCVGSRSPRSTGALSCCRRCAIRTPLAADAVSVSSEPSAGARVHMPMQRRGTRWPKTQAAPTSP